MSDEKLSEESAKKELQNFYDYYEIDLNEMPQEQLEPLLDLEKTIIKGIQKGVIYFRDHDEHGFCVVQKTRKGVELTYREMNGDAKLAMSSKDDSDISGQCYALLGSLSGEGASVIKKLRGPDLKRAERIGAMLLYC